MTKTVKFLISLVAILVCALLISFADRPKVKEYSPRTKFIDTLNVVIGVEGGMYYSKGFPIGAQYDLLKRFAALEGIHLLANDDFQRDSSFVQLLEGGADIIVLNPNDSLSVGKFDSKEFAFSLPVMDAIWIVRNDHQDRLLERINNWLGYFSKTKEFKALNNKYFGSYSLDKYRESLTQTDKISPYDDLIKKYSTVLGWDWRMLAAIIYKESRFSVAAESSRGAKGLMQVRDFTAQSYGVENRLDPEQNIYAGVRFLSEIQSRYLRSGLDSVNSLKFTLAAYNAGESRIGDCIRFTHEQGGNSANWESVSRYIPMMSLPEYYQNAEYLNHGSFNGSETIQYVDDVASIYEEYLFLVKK
ncbi:MAG: transglycosylase SLT domain-containing protein [Bacteroidales bacterium]|nr:transglycosylase SLT domain-containing protein [Bacteroidales bacterium]